MSASLYVVPSPDAEGASPADPSTSRWLLDEVVEAPAHGSDPLVGPHPHDLATHLQRFGPRPTARGEAATALIDALDAIGLSGRGGAHFPAVIKWRGVRAAGGGGTVIVNGAEGEPLAAKDASLLQFRPHLVLDGLVSAGEALGAVDLVIWLHDGAYATHRAVTRAMEERRMAGYVEPPMRIVTGPDRYITGESSAVIRALNGGPTLPELVRVLPVISGVHGRPTLLHNAETLARVGILARTGVETYQPTSLLTVLTGGRRRVVEVTASTTFAEALEQAAPLPGAAAPQAVLLGGYGGSWVRWDALADLPVDQPALRAAGLSLGASIVAPLPHGTCGLVETARIATYLAASSARQCGPCMFGLPAVGELAWALADCDVGRSELKRLDRFLHEIERRGACAHPDGAVRMVASALDVFADDVKAHRKGHCVHGRTYKVIPVPEVD